MSRKKTGKSQGQGVEEYLREYEEIKPSLSPGEEWAAAGEADQDLAGIFQEFQNNASEKRRRAPRVTGDPTGVLPQGAREIQSGHLAPRHLAGSDRAFLQSGPDDPAAQLLEEAKIYISDLMRRTGPAPARQPEEHLEEYLREYHQKEPDLASGSQRIAGGEADQDLSCIFREFRSRISKRYPATHRTRAKRSLRAETRPRRTRPGNGGGSQDGVDDLISKWLDRAAAYSEESDPQAGSHPAHDLEPGEQVEEYLREYYEMQEAEEEWDEVEEAEQDLEGILEEFQGRISREARSPGEAENVEMQEADEEWDEVEEAEEDLEGFVEEFQERISRKAQSPGDAESVEADAEYEDVSESESLDLESEETLESEEEQAEEGTEDVIGQLHGAESDLSRSIQEAGSKEDSQAEAPSEKPLQQDHGIDAEQGQLEATRDSNQDLTAIFQEFQSGASDESGNESSTETAEGSPRLEQPQDPVHQLYEKTKAFVVESIRRVGADRAPDLEEGAELVGEIIDSLTEQTDLLLIATEKEQPFSLGAHCVNVCITAQRIAATLEYGRGRCIQMGLAALLHEIGVVRAFSRQIEFGINEPTEELRQRTVFSAEILEKLCPEHDWLYLTVGQVFEREDGSGFPLGLEGDEIREEAKVVGIADLLESCIHARSHRKALTGYEVMTDMSQKGAQSFSSRVAKALISSFSIYMYNEYVLLNTGEVGRVTEVNRSNVMRPEIELIYDADGQKLAQPQPADMAKNSSRYVVQAVHPDDLPLKPNRKGKRRSS